MRIGWIAAALALMPGTALAQETSRTVLFSVPGVTAFVPEEVTGPQNRRAVELMLVFAERVDGGDVHLNPWTVDCTTMSAQPLNGRAFVGTRFVKDTATGGPMKPTEPGSFERAIADYSCTGKRESSDDSIVRSFADAIAYGRKLTAK